MDEAIREMMKDIDRLQRNAQRVEDLLNVMNYEAYMKKIDNWKESFCIIPRRCKLTYKIMWMQKCVKGVYKIYGPAGESPIKVKIHVDPLEFTAWKLKS